MERLHSCPDDDARTIQFSFPQRARFSQPAPAMKLRESGKARIRCGELGEDRLIARLVAHLKMPPQVIAGPGDDCAVVATPGQDHLLLLKTDCVVEEIHFLPNEKPSAIGRKAMMRALSDFAAMSGLPQYALV